MAPNRKFVRGSLVSVRKNSEKDLPALERGWLAKKLDKNRGQRPKLNSDYSRLFYVIYLFSPGITFSPKASFPCEGSIFSKHLEVSHKMGTLVTLGLSCNIFRVNFSIIGFSGGIEFNSGSLYSLLT
jgi:hypothetical protein